jgi:hypothetical protein
MATVEDKKVRVVAQKMSDRSGIVTIEADSQEEVMSAAAKTLAINTAQAGGIPRAGVGGQESPYPVDAKGNTSDELMMGQGTVVAYRCDYKLTGGL